MSTHKSLKTKGSLVRSRNVLTRYERIIQLRKHGRWTEDSSSPYGLAKVRVLKAKKRGKEKKKKEEGEGVAAAQPAQQAGAAPAAAAKGAKSSAPAAGKPASPAKK
jgi:small basic protein (TIGR04137 family)